MDRLSRRAFVRVAAGGTLAGLAGCQGLVDREGTPDTPTTVGNTSSTHSPTAGADAITGRVTDRSADAIADATVRVILPTRGVVGETHTDQQGRYALKAGAQPVWLRATAPGYVQRTIAAAPGTTRHVELTSGDGTVALSFGGDVMFGRRFYEASDPLEPHARLQSTDRVDAHHAVLQYVAPLLQDADVTSVNIETPLTTTAWRHPAKRYTFVSHPAAAPAMARAGIDYVALGNNHTFDALPPGLEETRKVVTAAGIEHSGAGGSQADAWAPVYVDTRGVTVGFLSCTTVTGDQYDIDWAADGGQSTTHTVSPAASGGTASDPLEFSGDVGVAAATESRLTDWVDEVDATADVTVVQIHGGEEYQRTPTDRITSLTDAAITAGADVIVNHHPHVTGGLERRNGALVAWTLGNLVFDQELWATFPSGLLTVHCTAEGVTRAYFDPLLIEGYVPKGVVGKPRAWQTHTTAGLSSAPVSLGDGTVEYGAAGDTATRTATRRLDGAGAIYARESGWVTEVVEGAATVELGRDLCPTGTFDEVDIDAERHEGPLWRFSRGPDSNGPGFGVDGSGGMQLTRAADNTERALLTTSERVPCSRPLTVHGQYRHETATWLELLVRWYAATSGEALESVSFDLPQTTGWESFQRSLDPPAAAGFVRPYLRLYPPDEGEERVARLDDVRLIEWYSTAGAGGRQFDHLRVRAPATVEFATRAAADSAISWRPLDGRG